MTNLMDPGEAEARVGATRHATEHYGRANTRMRHVYVLHSTACLADETTDLRECEFSLALDRGIDAAAWLLDEPVVLTIEDDALCGRTAIPDEDRLVPRGDGA